MITAAVLQPTQLLIQPEDYPKTEVRFNWGVKEQECLSFLKSCKSIEEFKQVHGHVLKVGLFYKSFCASSLVATCALSSWGNMDYASSVFRQIEDPGGFEYNSMIRGHVKDLDYQQGLLLYVEMVERGVGTNNFTYPSALKACAGLEKIRLRGGIQVHGQVVKLGLQSDVFVQNSLINMYGKCGKLEESCAVFTQMEHKTIASWSALIAAHANMRMWWECLHLFEEMNTTSKGEESILVNVISACTHLGALDSGRLIHGYLFRNMTGLNVIIETCLMDMYIKCGHVEKGLLVFQRMGEKNERSYSVVISGLAMNGQGEESLRIFSEMLNKGLKPDDVVYLGVLSACRYLGRVKEGLKRLDQMKVEHGIEPTIQHYGCIVDLLGRSGKLDEALQLVNDMPMDPNDVVWRALLSASRVHHNLKVGEISATKLMESGSDNAGDYVMLANMYANAQMWEDAAMARTNMASKGFNQDPGFCLIEVKRKMHRFVSQDMSHPSHVDIYEMIHQMEWQLKFEGYHPDISEVPLDVDEEEKTQRLRHHSQKLALAFALMNTCKETPIRIVRNIRMCRDCHTYTKMISTVYDRQITVRDRNHFHYFKEGRCSCKDYW